MAERADTPLKRILESEGRSQAWLARALGVTRQSVGLWVHGIYTPVPDTQVAIAGLLGRSVGELWPGHGESSDQEPAAADAGGRQEPAAA